MISKLTALNHSTYTKLICPLLGLLPAAQHLNAALKQIAKSTRKYFYQNAWHIKKLTTFGHDSSVICTHIKYI